MFLFLLLLNFWISLFVISIYNRNLKSENLLTSVLYVFISKRLR